MTDATLRQLFSWVFALPLETDQFTVVWHAGEPLVLGPDYYRRAFDIIAQAKPGDIRIDHSFQTNGLLLSPAWVTFLRETGAGIGVSLDGPRDLHDRNRRTRRGAGTFDGTMRGVKLLQDGGIPFHVISVLTRDSLFRAEEMFEFYVRAGIDWVGFNIDEMEGEHASTSMASHECEAMARRFFETFLGLNAAAGHPISVREFEGVAQAVLTSDSPRTSNQQADPFRIISVDVDGNLSTFSPELLGFSHKAYGPFIFGNIWADTIETIRANPAYRAVDRDIRSGVDSCRRSCEYFSLCRGGAPANKVFENGTFDSTETIYCRITKKVISDVVLEGIEDKLMRPAPPVSAEAA